MLNVIVIQLCYYWSNLFTWFLAVLQTSASEKKRNFIETVEAHVMLGVDPRRGDQVHCFI